MLKYRFLQVREITADIPNANLQYIIETIQSSSILEVKVHTITSLLFQLFEGKWCALSHLYDMGVPSMPTNKAFNFHLNCTRIVFAFINIQLELVWDSTNSY